MKLNLRSIDLNLLPVFEAIMVCGQLTRAAQQLGMSQPALSAAVQRLRATFNDQLFVRTRLGVQPTPRAQEIHSQLQPLLEQMRSSLSPAREFDPSHSSHCFHVLSGDYFELVVLPNFIKRIQEKAPLANIKVTTLNDDSEKLLLSSEADVILDAFPVEDNRLICEEIHGEQLVVIARADHPSLNQATLLPHEYFEAFHAVLPERGRRLPLSQLAGEALSKKRKVALQVSHYSSLLVAVSNSDLIATFPSTLAKSYAKKFNLKVFPWPFPQAPINIHLMRPKVLMQDPAHMWFLKELKKSITETQGLIK